MITKLDFTKDKLKVIVLELANLNGYQKPSTYLDDLLEQVKTFNSFDFECELFLNIHYLCKENSDKFWSDGHKQDIIKWLKKSPIMTDVFDTTFLSLPPPKLEKKVENLPNELIPLFKKSVENPQKYIDILKNLNPPIINNKNEFIKGVHSKNKTPIVAWNDVIDKQGLFLASGINRTDAINKEISNLEITHRSFGNITEKYNRYYTEIETLLSKLLN